MGKDGAVGKARGTCSVSGANIMVMELMIPPQTGWVTHRSPPEGHDTEHVMEAPQYTIILRLRGSLENDRADYSNSLRGQNVTMGYRITRQGIEIGGRDHRRRRVLVGRSQGILVQRAIIGPLASLAGVPHTAPRGATVHDAFPPFPQPKKKELK